MSCLMVSRSCRGSTARLGIVGNRQYVACGDRMVCSLRLRGKRVPSESREWEIGGVITTIVYIWSQMRWG